MSPNFHVVFPLGFLGLISGEDPAPLTMSSWKIRGLWPHLSELRVPPSASGSAQLQHAHVGGVEGVSQLGAPEAEPVRTCMELLWGGGGGGGMTSRGE